MVYRRFIFLTLLYVNAVCVCVCPSLPSLAFIMDIWNSVPVSRSSRGDYSSASDIVILGGAWLYGWLNESGRLCCCEFLYSSKGEERCSTEEKGGKNKVATLSCFSRWKGMTTNTWGHFLISSLSTQTGHIIQQELYSTRKSHPPMGISPFLKTVVLYLLLWLSNLYHTVFMEEWFLTLPNTETFFHFLISKQGSDVLGLEETGWGEEAGSALWDNDEIIGVRREDHVEIQKMCWPQVVI